MTVEGGFLDGFDLRLSPGMNVLIGGRGTGKTSVIELIRFCLEVENYTDVSGRRSREHALAVLQDGQIVVTLVSGDNRVSVSRTASVPASARRQIGLPIIFSQTDIEALGLEASGRLRLIDSFRVKAISSDFPDPKLVSTVQSLTTEMQTLCKEMEAIEIQLAGRQALESQLKELSEEEKKVTAQSKAAQDKQKELQRTTQQIAVLGVSADVTSRAGNVLRTLFAKLDAILAVPPTIERWPKEAGPVDRLLPIRSALNAVIDEIGIAATQLHSAIEKTTTLGVSINGEKAPLDNQARELRKAVEKLQQGAGAISRAASQVREKLTQLEALVSLKTEKRERLSVVQRTRGNYLDKLDSSAEQRFNDRIAIANNLNSQLGPRIRTKPIRAAQLNEYATAVSAALRGSGLRYTELASAIAVSMSPRELIELVEDDAEETIANLLNISADRATRLISHLREHGTAEILTAAVEDDISLELLDGTEYKNIESLSMGQRCTVVLPIVLEHRDRVLIVDQPEDHLDNAFVVDTLIKAILNRGTDAQLILSTHNANIPVLGSAEKVVVMGSDGQRGFIVHAGTLEEAEVVESITNIMEGGAEAFERRAEFYKAHLAPNE